MGCISGVLLLSVKKKQNFLFSADTTKQEV